MTSNWKETSLIAKEVKAILQEKVQAKKLIVRDQGFGFYYPGAVQVKRQKLELIRREVKLD